MIGQRVGRYRVLDRIGKGGMGEVYLAEDSSLGRKVALKFLTAKLQEDEVAHKRLLREAKSAAALDHPFICNVHEVDQTASAQDYIVMEFVPGESLNKILARGPLPLTDSLRILQETAEALQEAHSKGIVHRDLKPSNIMVTTGGHSKVMDFGLAKRTDQSDDPEITSVLTEEGKVLGTPAYMSPEQLQGNDFDTRADIFSLGIVALQMVTGKHPFHNGSIAATVSAIIRDPPAGLEKKSLPDELRKIVSRMLEKDPEKRYPGCGDLLDDLQDAMSVLSYPTTPIEFYRRTWSWKTYRKPILLSTLGALALFGIIFHQAIIDQLQLAPLPEKITLAVLPFTFTGQDGNEEALAIGLNENLAKTLSRLSMTHPFNVVPDNLARERDALTPDLIGQKLGANLALSASFQVHGGAVEMFLELVTEGSKRRLRHARVSGPYQEPAALESMLVESIVEMLGSEIAPSDRQSVYDVGFHNTGAYHLYLRGLGYQIGHRDLDSAIEAYENVRYLEGRSAPAEAGHGLCLLEKYRNQKVTALFDEAMTHCLEARSMDENSFEAHRCLGELALEQDNDKEALTRFETAYALEPTNDEILNRLELMYTRTGKRARIEALYRAAIGRQPDFWRNFSRLGTFYFDGARYSEAIEQWQQVIVLAPKYGRAFNALGSIYASLFCWDQALLMFEKARKWDTQDVVNTNVATAYFFAGRYAEAVQEAESAIVFLKEGDYPAEYYKDFGNLADIHYWSPGGFAKKAEDCYRRAIFLAEEYLEHHPGDCETLSYLGVYSAMLAETKTALHYLNESLSPAQENTKNLYRAALIHRVLGNTGQSVSFVERYFESGGTPRSLKEDPAFDEIRKQPNYQKLASQYPDPGGCPE